MYILEINHGNGEIHRHFLLPGQSYTIGRKECRILLPAAEPSISRHHATLTVSPLPRYAALDPQAEVSIKVEDFSKHGTYVDNERMGKDATRFLYAEDRIRFGLRVTAHLVPMTFIFGISPDLTDENLDRVIGATIRVGALVVEDEMPAPSTYYEKHTNCVGFLYIAEEHFHVDETMMEALGYGYTVVTPDYIESLVKSLEERDTLMPSEFPSPTPPLPASHGMRSVRYRRPTQTFFSVTEFLSMGRPIVANVFKGYTFLLLEQSIQEVYQRALGLFGGVVRAVLLSALEEWRGAERHPMTTVVVVGEDDFRLISDLLMERAESKGQCSVTHARQIIAAYLTLYKYGVCLIPEENVHLALYRNEGSELNAKPSACYLQRPPEDVMADEDLTRPAAAPAPVPPTEPVPAPPAKTNSSEQQRGPSKSPSHSDSLLSHASEKQVSPASAAALPAATPAGASGGSSLPASETASPSAEVLASASPSAVPAVETSGEAASATGSRAKPPRTAHPFAASLSGAHTRGASDVDAADAGHNSPAEPSAEAAAVPGSSLLNNNQRSQSPRKGVVRSISKPSSSGQASPAIPALKLDEVSSTSQRRGSRTSSPQAHSAMPPRASMASSDGAGSVETVSATDGNSATHRRSSSLMAMPPLPPSNSNREENGEAGAARGQGASGGVSPHMGPSSLQAPIRRGDVSLAGPAPTQPRRGMVRTNTSLDTPKDTGDKSPSPEQARLDPRHVTPERDVVLHTAHVGSHKSPPRQRVEAVRIAMAPPLAPAQGGNAAYTAPPPPGDRRLSLSLSRDRDPPVHRHADPDEVATAMQGGSMGNRRSVMRRESISAVATRSQVQPTRRSSISYQRSDSVQLRDMATPHRLNSVRASGASVPRNRAHPYGSVQRNRSPAPQEVPVTGLVEGSGGRAAARESKRAAAAAGVSAPQPSSARRHRSGSTHGLSTSGADAFNGATANTVPGQIPGLRGGSSAGSASGMSNVAGETCYKTNERLGNHCTEFMGQYLDGFITDMERSTHMVARQTYMDSSSKSFLEGGIQRILDFLQYINSTEHDIPPMFSTGSTRASCHQVRQKSAYVLSKTKACYKAVGCKVPSCLTRARAALSTRASSPHSQSQKRVAGSSARGRPESRRQSIM